MTQRSFSLTLPTATVLGALGAGHGYGFELMEVTGLPGGTVYPILRRLERQGALRGRWEDKAEARTAGRPPRRYYSLTAVGEAALAEALERYPMLRFLPPGDVAPA